VRAGPGSDDYNPQESAIVSTMSVLPESRILLRGVAWETYERLRDEPRNDGLRLTYADGDLEVMAPSHRHERWHYLLGRAVEAMTEELGIPIHGGATTTFRSRRRKVGLEPDECWWVQHEAQVRGREVIDLAVDPPPDLVIEAEASRSALDKLPLFAALGIGEVWRYGDEGLTVHVRAPSGRFRSEPASRCFPFLPMPEFAARIAAARSTDETTWIRAFRVWVREHVRPG
jgi:Uma2 family endonuclease